MTSARGDWEARAGRRTEAGGRAEADLPPPRGLRAHAGAGQVTLEWEAVERAIGYLVHRDDGDGFAPVDHGGRDVLAVPGPVYCDTTGAPGRPCRYAVASVYSLEAPPGGLSEPVSATPSRERAQRLDAFVRADRTAGRLDRVWHMLGSEHVSQLLYEARTGGRPIGADVEEAYRMAVAELGAETVRAHAILHDELGVYRDGRFDFSAIDRVYDRLLATGLRPIVELSFMPGELALDPDVTVFEYRGIISPPNDWERWAELNRRLAEHLVERYGIDEVARWGFEVWNEPNLEVFWAGTQDDYFRLYELAVRAIKDVDERLRVGGPSTAAAGWVQDFLDFVVESGCPLDFLSTHTYGNLPLDARRALSARGLERVKVWWTEWGATPTHFNESSDLTWTAPYVLHGMKSVQGRADALAHWVVSDHFEELGRPPRLLHGGFGLLSVGSLRKPRWWALALAEALGDDLVELQLTGDGAGSLVDGWAAWGQDGRLDVLLWNGTLNQAQVSGDPLLDREVHIRIDGLTPGPRRVTLARVDRDHSNVLAGWSGDRDWPTQEEWQRLRAGDRLDEEQLADVDAGGAEVVLRLPMPGVARLRLEAIEDRRRMP